MVRGVCAAAGSAFAAAQDPLAVPDQTGYDPVVLLCTHGKNADGSKRIQGWCKDWVACIQEKAQPTQSEVAVMSAWGPAHCKEYCGVWPASPAEGDKTPAFLQTEPVAAWDKSREEKCLASCGNFQKSLSSCVTTILFEPGKVASMGLSEESAPKGPEICTKKDSPCSPDLNVRSQKCLGHKTKRKLSGGKHEIPDDCGAGLEMDLENCKKCPQLGSAHLSQYHTFVGGCMDQLNAYWQATHPHGATVPGATGCTVHG